MKYKKMVLLFSFVFFFLILHTNAATGEKITISFYNKNAYDAIINSLGDTVQYECVDESNSIKIYEDELLKVKRLDLNNSGISSLQGISNFTELEELNLANNKIEDIKEIKDLNKLKSLNLRGNKISNLAMLDYLPLSLKFLDLSSNYGFGDSENSSIMSKLSRLINLEELIIIHNSMKTTEGISNLTNLKYLNLFDNYIENIDGIASLTNLEVLNLGENRTFSSEQSLENLNAALSPLQNLKELNLSTIIDPTYNGQIIPYLPELPKLEILNLEANNITDISNISNYTNLKELILYNNKISDMTPLAALSKLEYLYIGRNLIRNIPPDILNGNTLVWPSIKHLGVSENRIIDSNMPVSLKTMAINHEISLDYEYIYDTSNLPHIDSDGNKYVTYEDFGARSDGIYDDFIAIRNAHIYANEHNVDIKSNTGKTYHIFAYYNLPINVNTSIDWNNSNFIIHDEKIDEMSCRGRYLFKFSNNIKTIKIENPTWTVNKNTKRIPQIVEKLNEDSDNSNYNKFYVKVINSNKKQYIRTGSSANIGDSQLDVFLIDKEGNVLNDIQWDFDVLTNVEIYPIPNESVYVKNGIFTTNNIESLSEVQYGRQGAKIASYYRSLDFQLAFNYNISNIKHTYPIDEISGSYSGFIYINQAANINVENSYLFARKYNLRSGYDLNFAYIVNGTFKNITSNDLIDRNRWGIMGSNYSKDILIDNCSLNRIDAHRGYYNLTVKNSDVGSFGHELIGQNDLSISNTVVTAYQFIVLRSDYGSTWDGNVYITNSTLRYLNDNSNVLIRHTPTTDSNGLIHDYGYELHFPNVYVENFTIDDREYENVNEFMVINNSNQKNDLLPQSYFPDTIYINKIKYASNSNKPIKLFSVDADYLKGNYVITDLDLLVGNENYTHKFNIGETFSTDKSVTLTINKQSSSENSVSIYRNDELIINNQEISNKYNYNFTDDGKYKIVLKSKDSFYNHIGTKEFEFEIIGLETLLGILQRNNYTVNNGFVYNFIVGESVLSIRNKLGSDVIINTGNTIISTGAVITRNSERYVAVIKGDVNGDGKISPMDYVKVKNHIMKINIIYGNEYLDAANMNNDEKISPMDYVKIKNCIMNK